MNIWENAVITNKGLALQAKLTQGHTLEITRAVVGAGFIPPTKLQQQTAVSDPKQTLEFHTVSYPEDGKCAIPTTLTNAGLTTGYTARNIGVYAMDPDAGEILYFIAGSTTEDMGTIIPAEKEMPSYSAEWTFYFQYGNADGVTVVVNPANAVTWDDMRTYAATKKHEHSTDDVTNGILPPERGGTGSKTVDTTPTKDSKNMVTSGGVFKALEDKANSADVYKHPDTHPASMITGLATVATSGSYNDLKDKPTIPTVPSSLPANGGDADTVDGKHASDFAAAKHGHSYNDLSDKPTIPEIPTSLPANGGNADTVDGKHASDFAAAKHGHSYNDLSDKPTIPAAYTHPTTSGNKHIPAGGSTGQILRWQSDGTAVWGEVDGLKPITTAGTGAAYTATVGSITALTAGVSFMMVPHTVSTSKTPTLNVNSLGAKQLRRRLSNMATSLEPGYAESWLASGKPFRVTYDGTYWVVEDHAKPAAADLYGTLAIAKGGTGATDAATARANLGVYSKTETEAAITAAIGEAIAASY